MHNAHFHRDRYRSWRGATICAVLLFGSASPGIGQQPVPPPFPAAPTPATPPPSYRPPSIALVQPALGASVPADKPVVIFRYVPGEVGDPIDVRSLAVSVDGRDRSKLFQATTTEAWGPIAVREGDPAAAIETGSHAVVARICSVRGACSEVAATVQVVAPTTAVPDKPAPSRRRAVIDALLEAARWLLKP